MCNIKFTLLYFQHNTLVVTHHDK